MCVNNTRTCARENFSCHLGYPCKIIDCKNCIKKWICPLPDEPTFKENNNGKTFYEYIVAIENRKMEIAQQMENAKNNINSDLIDYDWISENDDRN